MAGGDSGFRVVFVSSPAPPGALLFQPVRQPPHPRRLLAVADHFDALRVNGQAAPPATVLRENDFVQWGPEVSFVVALVHRSALGPPSPEDIGRPCPICRVPFSADAVTFGCACGTRVHCDGSEDGLQCAQRSGRCPSCCQPIDLEGSLTGSPA
jgi:hypothetical protein